MLSARRGRAPRALASEMGASAQVELVPGDEWNRITESAFEVDTQVIHDKVTKGRWTVKNGKTTFVPYLFWPGKDDDGREDV